MKPKKIKVNKRKIEKDIKPVLVNAKELFDHKEWSRWIIMWGSGMNGQSR